jgi:hypothetical protein
MPPVIPVIPLIPRTKFSHTLLLSQVVSLAVTIVLSAGCDVPGEVIDEQPGEPAATSDEQQSPVSLPSCSSACGLAKPCSTGCSVNGAATTCGAYSLGTCGMEGKDPGVPEPTNPGGGGGSQPLCTDAADYCHPAGSRKLLGQTAIRNKVFNPHRKDDPAYTTRILNIYAQPQVSREYDPRGCSPIRCRCDYIGNTTGGVWQGPTKLPTGGGAWPGSQSRSWGMVSGGACKHY